MKNCLNGNWKAYRNDDKNKSWNVNVPGTLFSDLAEQGVVPDWFHGCNEENSREFFEKNYTYECRFHLPSDSNPDDLNYFLECDGLDTLATISLNGHEIAKTKNMFRRYSFPLGKELKRNGTENILQISFDSTVKYIEKMHRKDPLAGVDTTLQGYQHIRKAHSNFGWDWGPKLPDLGIWRPIAIAAYQKARIDDLIVEQLHGASSVELKIGIKIDNFSGCKLPVLLKLLGPDGTETRIQTESDETGNASSLFRIENPGLWWPNGYGSHPLYSLECEIRRNDGTLDDLKKIRIGLRKTELVQNSDRWGKTFMFVVNGVPVFAKGACWIPEDALHGRRHTKMEFLVQSSATANFNMLRVWGGGYYPDDEFYDLCDRLGIMVWQDFMFACSCYRLTPEFTSEVKAEITDNIKRLRHHASIVLWCGNNENETGICEWWKFQDRQKALDEYTELFEKIIPELCAQFKVQAPYWPSSPSSGGKFNNPNGDNSGDCHYWTVWHGNQDFRGYAASLHRFLSEFGFQSFPCLKTVESYCPPDEFDIESKTMLCHQRSGIGNRKISEALKSSFRPAKDFKSFLYQSLVYQAIALKFGIEHWRALRSEHRCMGTLYWQLNDNWPVASWASIDYFGRWKPLHYAARRFYAPIIVSNVFDSSGTVSVFLVNDSVTDLEGRLTMTFYGFNGEKIWSSSSRVSCPRLDSAEIAKSAVPAFIMGGRRDSVVFHCEFAGDNGVRASNSLELDDPLNLKLENPCVRYRFEKIDSDKVEIILDCDSYAPFLVLDMKESDVIFSDNFFNLIPGEKVKIRCAWHGELEDFKKEFYATSLFDSYSK